MADVHNPATRSYNMSRIKGKNTKPEMHVRKFLHAKGFRYKLHDKTLPGKPDIVLPKYKTVIEVLGCQWHGHEGCRFYVIPKTNTEFWVNKVRQAQERDKKNHQLLRSRGWKVIEIWECELRQDAESLFRQLLYQLVKTGL
jgi:DNA mismatch endonuclease, patch repair protein